MKNGDVFLIEVFLFAVFLIFTSEAYIGLRYLLSKLFKSFRNYNAFDKKSIVIHILAAVGLLCVLYAHFIEPYWLEVNNIDITTPKLKNTSLRVVQISDIHSDKKVINENKIIPIINDLKPDIIVFTGDSLDTASALGTFKNTLRSLNAGLGKFLVSGNNDIAFETLGLFNDTGFIDLSKNTVSLSKNGNQISVSGLDYGERRDLFNVVDNTPKDSYNIFLYHTPDLIEKVKDKNVDLYLAGHTHGGQIRMPFYGALITLSQFGKKYEMGRYDVGNTVLYTNRGLGMEGNPAPRVRFLARPEVAVFDINPAKSTSR